MTEPLSYRNQSIELQSKSMDWFLYGRDLCHEKVKVNYRNMLTHFRLLFPLYPLKTENVYPFPIVFSLLTCNIFRGYKKRLNFQIFKLFKAPYTCTKVIQIHKLNVYKIV